MSVENPAAFPSRRDKPMRGGGSYRDDLPGMTLRDWFAGQALALIRRPGSGPHEIAKVAYSVADAMLAARTTGPEPIDHSEGERDHG